MNTKQKYACIIPVAGLSSRMGDFKPLLKLNDGQTMIAHTVRNALSAGVQCCILVLGYQGKKIEEVFLNADYKDKLMFVYNHDYAQTDMLFSVQLGLRALKDKLDFNAAFVLPGDMPRISADTLIKLISFYELHHSKVTFPMYQNRVKHPPLIARNCFSAILNFTGEGGLRKALANFASETAHVQIDDFGCCLDADTKADFRLVRSYQH